MDFNELSFFNKSIPLIGYSGFVNAIEAMIPFPGAISQTPDCPIAILFVANAQPHVFSIVSIAIIPKVENLFTISLCPNRLKLEIKKSNSIIDCFIVFVL